MPLKVPLNTITALMRSFEHSAEMSVACGRCSFRFFVSFSFAGSIRRRSARMGAGGKLAGAS